MASSRRRKCKNKPDSFCYVCGCYALLRQRRNITSFVKRAYKAYFQIPLGDQDKKWSSHIVCHNCEEMLRDWTKGKRKGLPFGVPMIWREPRDHVTDCYFCMVNTKGVEKKNRHKISYPSIPSAIRPVPHCEELPVPVFSDFSSCADSDDYQQEHEGCNNEMVSESESFSDDTNPLSAPELFSQMELNDLVRDLGLSKKAAEVLASRLQEKHLLDDSAKVSYFRKRYQSFVTFFSEQKQFVYCHNIPGLLRQLGVASYTPTEWRLFLDSSKQSLKCVLLHNGNLYGGVPIGHSVHLRETYDD